jgi:uncharacterized protein GlcG (DUF336 family)
MPRGEHKVLIEVVDAEGTALRFIRRDDMEAEGYAAYLDQVEDVHD